MVTNTAIASDIVYGLELLLSGANADVVAIFSQNGSSGQTTSSTGNVVINSILGQNSVVPSFGQMFAEARPLKATVRETARVMEHPVENAAGSITNVADHKIVNPVEIDLPLLIRSQDYASMYGQIKAAFLNSTLLSVQTRTGIYANMYIANMPHDESPDIYDAITLLLHLKQAQIVSVPTTYSPAAPANSNTVQNGLQQPQSVTNTPKFFYYSDVGTLIK